MFPLALEELQRHAHWQKVLEGYRCEQQAAERQSADDGERWVARIAAVEGVPAEQLPRIHGKLIALGLLQFQLLGRTDGVLYRVSRDGLRALRQIDEPAAADVRGSESESENEFNPAMRDTPSREAA